MDKVQKLSSNECYTPSSEPFRMDSKVVLKVKTAQRVLPENYYELKFYITLSTTRLISNCAAGGVHSALVTVNEELLERKVAALV
jgi:hypothetical protein